MRKSQPTLSVCILTRDSGPYLENLLSVVRGFADELVVAVDAMSQDSTEAIASRYADRLFLVDSPGYLETALGWLSRQCEGDWILRLDDDELPSQGLVDALPGLMADRRFTYYHLPRRWVVPESKYTFISQQPWWPDYQLRLFRNINSLYQVPSVLHSSHQVQGAGSIVTRGSLYHFDFVFHDDAARLKKLTKYASVSPKGFLGGYYFPAWDNVAAESFPLDDPPASPTGLSKAITDSIRVARREMDGGMSDSLDEFVIRKTILKVGEVPLLVQRDSEFTVPVRLVNVSEIAWGEGKLAVRLSYHWCDQTGNVVEFDGLRTPLPYLLNPSEETSFLAKVKAPVKAGRWVIQWDLVIEYVTWFSDKGFKGGTDPVRVVDWRPFFVGKTGSSAAGHLLCRQTDPVGTPPVAPFLVGLDRTLLESVARQLDRSSSSQLGLTSESLVDGPPETMLALQGRYPGARFLYCLQDGRTRTLAPDETWRESATHWSSATEGARATSLALHHYKEIRIEDLLRDREKILKESIEFLGGTWLLNPAEDHSGLGKEWIMSATNSSGCDEREYIAIAGGALYQFGYIDLPE